MPSRIGYLLDIAPRELEKVLYFAASIITHVDQDGELTLPADEQLGDVDETEAVLAGESKSEEAEDEAGPFEEAPNLADIELEE